MGFDCAVAVEGSVGVVQLEVEVEAEGGERGVRGRSSGTIECAASGPLVVGGCDRAAHSSQSAVAHCTQRFDASFDAQKWQSDELDEADGDGDGGGSGTRFETGPLESDMELSGRAASDWARDAEGLQRRTMFASSLLRGSCATELTQVATPHSGHSILRLRLGL